MPLSALPNASTILSSCNVCIILLNKEELQISVESKNVKIGFLFSKVCERLAIKEKKYFGLAQERDGEFRFLKMHTKLQKFASKLWKSKHVLAHQPVLTFYLRVQYYVDNIGLLREPVTRLQYYLQLRDNLLHYGRISNEEKCFVLAAYALQADFGPYNANVHVASYFDPCRYFPAWVIMRRGREYITSNLPAMHRDLTSMTRTDAQNAFIRELLSSSLCHNFHLYRLRRHKYDNVSTLWIAVGPKGLEILEETNDFKNPIAVFLWQNIEKLHCDRKKFEIVTDALAERKFSYYTASKEWGEHLLNLCRSMHHFQIALQPHVTEIMHQEAQDRHFREMYVHDGNVGSSYGHQRQITVPGYTGQPKNATSDSFAASPSPKVTDHHLGFVQNDEFAKTPSNEGIDHREIMIVSPPLMSSTLTTVSPMSDQSTSPLWLLTNEKLHSKRPSGISSSFRQTSATTGIGLPGRKGLNDKQSVSSFAKSNSSEESLITGSLSSSNSQSYGQLQQSLSSSPALKEHRSRTKNDLKAASSVYSMTSWLSTSPNSSTSSSQFAFSIPAKSTVVDAASLRKSLPHGTTLNEYISQIMSGENTELLASKYQKQRCRKSSLDQPKLCFTYADSDNLLRSASFGQAKKLSIHETQGTSQAYDTSFLKENGNKNYSREYQVLAQQLPQVPIAAQAQKTVTPKKVAAISSTAARPAASCAPGVQVDAGGEYLATLFSPEKHVSKFAPLHSTPMISRYQMQEIRTADVPVLNFTSANSANLCFMPSQIVPSPSLSAPSVVTTSEFDYRCHQYFPQILGCSQNTSAKPPPAFGEFVMGNGPRHDAVLAPSSSWTVQMCPRPPAYSEWQAAKALASLNAERNAERMNLVSRSSEQRDKMEDIGERHRLQNGFVDGKSNREVYLSVSPATDGGNMPTSSVSEALTLTSVPTVLQLPYSFQEHTDQHNSLMLRSVEAVRDACRYNADDDGLSSSVSVKNLNGQQKGLVSGEPVSCKGADVQINVREKLQNLGTNLPLISALLKDKSLLAYHNKPDRLREFRLIDATAAAAAVAGTSAAEALQNARRRTLGSSEQDLYGGTGRRHAATSGAAAAAAAVQGGVTTGNGMRHRSMEVLQAPSVVGDNCYHSQRHSDSIVLSGSPIAGRC